MQRAGLILWPSFLVAGVAEAVIFSIFDPVDLSLIWDPFGPTRLAAYSQGFLVFWMFTAASSALTLFLQRTSKP